MSTKHTPLRIETSPDGTVIRVIGANDQTITAIDWGFDIAGAADMARLIVLAVNPHHDLVEALEKIVELIESGDCGSVCTREYAEEHNCEKCKGMYESFIDPAHAALSKAKGE